MVLSLRDYEGVIPSGFNTSCPFGIMIVLLLRDNIFGIRLAVWGELLGVRIIYSLLIIGLGLE